MWRFNTSYFKTWANCSWNSFIYGSYFNAATCCSLSFVIHFFRATSPSMFLSFFCSSQCLVGPRARHSHIFFHVSSNLPQANSWTLPHWTAGNEANLLISAFRCNVWVWIAVSLSCDVIGRLCRGCNPALCSEAAGIEPNGFRLHEAVKGRMGWEDGELKCNVQFKSCSMWINSDRRCYSEANDTAVLKDDAAAPLNWRRLCRRSLGSKRWLHNVMESEWHRPHSDGLPINLAFALQFLCHRAWNLPQKMKADRLTSRAGSLAPSLSVLMSPL